MYSEVEYLAGADEFGEWHTSRSSGDPQERPLRRLGAAAALTGALGALSGVIVFAGIGMRSAARRVAVSEMPAKPGVLAPREVDSAPSAGGDHARPTAGLHHVRSVAGRVVGRSARRRRAVSARAARSPSPERAAGSAPRVPAEPVGAIPTVAHDATRSDPGERAARSPTQSEFGFER